MFVLEHLGALLLCEIFFLILTATMMTFYRKLSLIVIHDHVASMSAFSLFFVIFLSYFFVLSHLSWFTNSTETVEFGSIFNRVKQKTIKISAVFTTSQPNV